MPDKLSMYRMPAEWESHAATWLAWPHYKLDWPGKFEPIPWVYAEIIRYLSRNERVEVIVNDAASEKVASRTLKLAHASNDNVSFHRWPTDRVWTRDSGCAFVASYGKSQSQNPHPVSTKNVETRMGHPTKLSAVKWRFNAWAKYPNWKRDEKIGSMMAEFASAKEIRPEFKGNRVVLEGGSIEVNGSGTLVTTEECLLSRVQQRNPGMKKR
ncbi:MAG TPA: agmatine deiminase family protein, partial [Terriglobales bacterium]|nr:agmatine deiminase family protein [Terriglobales bacterium]